MKNNIEKYSTPSIEVISITEDEIIATSGLQFSNSQCIDICSSFTCGIDE